MMVIYKLKNTVSPEGTVTRGLCEVVDGFLRSVRETYKIKLCGDGTIRDMKSEEEGVVLDPDTGVSMNFWGFMPSVYDRIEEYFNAFLNSLPEGELRAEALLPTMVDSMIKSGELRVRVLETASKWFGITYIEDKPIVREKLRSLHEAGLYPDRL